MALFFFDTRDGDRDQDEAGTGLPDWQAACREAVGYTGLVLAHEPEVVGDGRDFRVELRDEGGGAIRVHDHSVRARWPTRTRGLRRPFARAS